MYRFRAVLASPKRGSLVWLAFELVNRIRHLLVPDPVNLFELIERFAEGRIDRATILDAYQAFQRIHFNSQIGLAQDRETLIREAVTLAVSIIVGDMIEPEDDQFQATREMFSLIVGFDIDDSRFQSTSGLFLIIEALAETCCLAVIGSVTEVPLEQGELPPRSDPLSEEENSHLSGAIRELNISLLGRDKDQQRTWEAEEAAQCDLVREIIAPPFALSFPASFRTPTVLSLARRIYEDRAFEGLPILADALEEAGCRDEHLLAHCRSEIQHLRGCWGLDLVLDRPFEASRAP
jgi:hypothetical protein